MYRDARGLRERHSRRAPAVRVLELRRPIDHLLRLGAENEMRVEARASDDSRWYSGAGIYRERVAAVGGAGAPRARRARRSRTPEIDDDGAVVTVAAEVGTARCDDVAGRRSRSSCVDAAGAVVARSETPVTTFPGDTIAARTAAARRRRRSGGAPIDPYLYTCRATLARR